MALTNPPAQRPTCDLVRHRLRIGLGRAGGLAGGAYALAGARPRNNQRAAALPRDVPCLRFLPPKLGRVLALALGAVLLGGAAPAGSDPNSAIAQWVKTLRTVHGASCCDDADCRPTLARQTDAGWEVWIGRNQYPGGTDAWEPVAPDVLAGTRANGHAPDSRTWACWYGGRVNCFLVGGGGM